MRKLLGPVDPTRDRKIGDMYGEALYERIVDGVSWVAKGWYTYWYQVDSIEGQALKLVGYDAPFDFIPAARFPPLTRL